ncbi:hypothetical protein ACFE04_005092 [Oxalis oulophora]
MDVARTELDFDIEKFIGEATCVNTEQSGSRRMSLNGTFSEKHQTSGSLPNDQSLTAAFAELSFGDKNLTGTLNPKSAPNQAFCQYPISLKNSVSGVGSQQVMVIPCFHQSPLNNGNIDKLVDPQEVRKMQTGYCQPVDLATARGYQLLPNVGVMPDQQPYLVDVGPGGVPYLHPPQFNLEQYYRLHQQGLYLEQLHNNAIQANGNIAMNQNQRQPYFETPSSQNDKLWSSYATTRGMNQSNSADYNAARVMGKQSLPEKILTRSNGLNTLKAFKFAGNETRSHHSENGKVLSNGHLCHLPNSGCFEVDGLNSWSDITDFKNSKSPTQKYNSLDEVTGRIYLMAKDQHGCRFLQRKFSEGTREDVDKIFNEIIDHIVELMTDPFGNYLVQKLLEVCREEQRMKILHAITRKLVEISCDMHGTRAVQKVIETLKTPEQFSMVVSSLKPGILMLIKSMNGNHVAQRCLQHLMPEYNEFLFEAATNHCVELATDRHGCCVLQKCLVHFDGEQRQHIVCQITSNALLLSQDPFGNYVVQYIFELELPWAETDVLQQLEGNFGDLAMQKYSSNVVEKCLKCVSEERRACIIRELIAHLDQVMQDPYGNYVIQAALREAKGGIHAALVEAIRPHVALLRTSPYGKKVLSCNSLKNKCICNKWGKGRLNLIFVFAFTIFEAWS